MTLKPKHKVSQFSDSSFIDYTTFLTIYKNELFGAESSSNRIFRMDQNLNLINFIGRAGHAPGEFNEIYCFTILKDTIYAKDEMGRRIHLFSLDGNFYRYFNIPVPYGQQFTISSNNRLFFNSFYSDSVVTVLNSQGKIIQKFGSLFDIENNRDEKELRWRNGRKLLIESNSLFAIGHFEPLVHQYSLSGELLNRYDLSTLPILSGWVQKQKQHYESQRQGVLLFIADAKIANDHLYLCIYNDKKADQILGLKISKDGLKPLILYKLENVSVQAFAIDQNELYIFDSNEYAIIKYQLESKINN